MSTAGYTATAFSIDRAKMSRIIAHMGRLTVTIAICYLLLDCSSTAETRTRVIEADGGPDADRRTPCERLYDAAAETWDYDAGTGVSAFGYMDKCVVYCAGEKGIDERAAGFCAEWGMECKDPEPWHLPEDGGAEYSRPGPYVQYCTYEKLP